MFFKAKTYVKTVVLLQGTLNETELHQSIQLWTTEICDFSDYMA